MKTDIEILTDSYNKYKDKKGKKATALRDRIECFKSLNRIIKRVYE